MVREQMALIQDVQTDEWWQDVTVPMLETCRGGACGSREADREAETQAHLHRFRRRDGQRDRRRAARLRGRHGLREVPREGAGILARAPGSRRDPQAADEQAAHCEPTWPSWSGCSSRAASATPEDVERASDEESQGLGLFVRSLVGLDREAAKEALAGFLAGKTLGGEPDRVREPDRGPPDRARRDGGRAALRVAVHGSHEPTSTLAGALFCSSHSAPPGSRKLPFLRMHPCGPLLLFSSNSVAYLRENSIVLASSVDPLVPRRFVFRSESPRGCLLFANHGSILDFSPTSISCLASSHMLFLDPLLFLTAFMTNLIDTLPLPASQ